MKALLCIVSLAAAASGSVDLLSSGPGGCSLVFSTGPQAAAGPSEEPLAAFEGMGLLWEPGKPVLPVRRLYIPVPPGAEPMLEYTIIDRSVSSALAGGAERAPALEGTGLSTIEVAAPPLDGPDRNVVLAGVIPLAGYSFAAVDIYPWLGEQGGSFASTVRIDLSWDAVRAGSTSRPSRLASLVCPFDVPFYRLEGSRAESPFWGRPWARLTISVSGGYEISCAELVSAGCDVEGAPSATLGMFTGPAEMFGFEPEDEHNLEPVGIEVIDGGDGVFDQSDRIRFIARGLVRWIPQSGAPSLSAHRWDDSNTYWLTWGDEPGARMGTLHAAPDASPQFGPVMHDHLMEEDLLWAPGAEFVNGWAWAALSPGGSFSEGYSLGYTPSGTGTILVRLCGESSGSKQYSVFLGDDLVYTGSWVSSGTWTLTIPGVSIPSSGEVRIESASSSSEDFFVDRIQIRAPVAGSAAADLVLLPGVERQGRFGFALGPFDSGSSLYLVDDFLAPVALTGYEISSSTSLFSVDVATGTHLLAVSADGWLSPDSIAPASPGRLVGTVSGADRLIVVPEVLSNELWGLLALYESQGISCAVATTREIFDEFGQGVADPGAIRSAVRWAMDSWESPPGGVLLVGDGHYDATGRTTSAPEMIFPWSRLSYTNPLSDDIYVMVHEDADLPELPIARLPVQSASELLTCTAKLIAQASGVNRGAWTNRMLFIADDEWGNDTTYDETFHVRDSEFLAEEMAPRSLERTKFYLIEYPWPPSGTHPKKPEAREAFLETFSEGFAAAIFFGHGSAGQLTHEGIMYSADVALLENGGRLPVSFWASCDVGHFDGTGEDAIGEKLILHPAGGSLASIAATRGTGPTPNYQLARSVLDSLLTHPGLTVSEALWQSKLICGSYFGNNEYYCLFGDLETVLPSPSGEVALATADDTLRTGESNHVTGTAGQESGVALVTVRESSSEVTYICRLGSEIDYLKYGGVAFRGSAAVSAGSFALDCLLPVQSVTGVFGRIGGAVPAPADIDAGGEDPVPVVPGTPPGGDYEGPEVQMWIEGQEGVEHPEVSGEPVLEASLSDPSGICFLGGSGRQLTLFVDDEGRDVSDSFSYDLGSSTQGLLRCETGTLPVGEHSLILWSFDGAGNSSRDTLQVSVRAPGSIAISEALVYPNPGSGLRCFSFRLSEDASVTVSIHTVSGRCIRRLESQCQQGYNQILWDGLDADGDEPATGAYVFRISAVSVGASSFESDAGFQGVLAVVR